MKSNGFFILTQLVIVAILVFLVANYQSVRFLPLVNKIFPTPVPNISGYTYNMAKIAINNHQINAEVADTIEKRTLGLSYRTRLGPNSGMIFLMENPALHSFWMRDMKIRLDIIWIYGSNIVDISPNVKPPTETEGNVVSVQPKSIADKVLEVNGGYAAKKGIKVGDTVVITY